MATRTQKRLKVKRLVKEQIIPSRRKYKTTYKDIRIWFNYLNDVVFDSKLTPFNDIQIKKIYDKLHVWGQVVIKDQKRKGTRQYVLEKHLPNILESIASELRSKADSEYKCQLLKNSKIKDKECI